MTIMTEQQYVALKALETAFQAWVDTKRGRNGWASYKPEEIPASVTDIGNEARSALEVWEFCHNPPERYFLYVNESNATVTTWTGDKLGDVRFGREYATPAFGVWPSKRVPVRINAINGRQYYGTYFKSAGQYARVRMVKAG